MSSLHWQQQASPGQENQLSGQARPAAGAGQCSQLTPVSGHLSSGRCTPSTVTTVTSHHWTLQHCRGDSEHWDRGDRDRTVTVGLGVSGPEWFVIDFYWGAWDMPTLPTRY